MVNSNSEVLHHVDGGGRFLRNTDNRLQGYTASQPARLPPLSSPPWEPQNSKPWAERVSYPQTDLRLQASCFAGYIEQSASLLTAAAVVVSVVFIMASKTKRVKISCSQATSMKVASSGLLHRTDTDRHQRILLPLSGTHRPEDGSSKLFWNSGLSEYAAQHFGRQPSPSRKTFEMSYHRVTAWLWTTRDGIFH
jgi:hypothetical protein